MKDEKEFLNHKSDFLVLIVDEGMKLCSDFISFLNDETSGHVKKVFKSEGFSGEYLETVVMNVNIGKIERICFVGIGNQDDLNLNRFGAVAGKVSQIVQSLGLSKVSYVYPDYLSFDAEMVSRELTYFSYYATYTFLDYKTEIKPKEEITIEEVEVLSPENILDDVMSGMDQGEIINEHVTHVRDLVNAPANYKTPVKFVDYIKSNKPKNVKMKVMGVKDLVKKGFGGLLSVARGSSEEPRFVILELNKKTNDNLTFCLVGKGVTFDAGGISLKPSKDMYEMKSDMGGAATVYGTISALAELGTENHVVALLPLTENLPDGNAQKPGDVITCYNGKTVEVLNTDAEGRLILADALAYACDKYKPNYLIDLATLTGAVVSTLGNNAAGVMSNDNEFVAGILISGQLVGEKCWELPLWDEYKVMVKSNLADVANIQKPARHAGTITAGAFLSNFVDEDVSWVHMDIAGTAWYDKDKPFKHSGASGFGVRLLIHYITNVWVN